jgi:hypothetical protein
LASPHSGLGPSRQSLERRLSVQAEFPVTGKETRNFEESSRFAKFQLENINDFSRVQMNSLRERTGN